QTYAIIEDQARLSESITEARSISPDGTITTQNSTLDYIHSDRGTMIGAMGTARSISLDPYGNKTTTDIKQSFRGIRDQARLESQRSSSVTLDIEGNKIAEQQPVTLRYQYDNK